MKNIELKLTTQKLDPKVRKLRKNFNFYDGHEVQDFRTREILNQLKQIKKNNFIIVRDAFGNLKMACCQQRIKSSCIAQDIVCECKTYQLVFNKDDRHCWSCNATLMISKELRKVWNKPLKTMNK